jgi:hypothetical protein
MQQIPRRRAHPVQQARGFPSPDADRHQHDVDGSETRDRQSADQRPVGVVPRGGQRHRIEGNQSIAKGFDAGNEAIRIRSLAAPDQLQPPAGHVNPAGDDRGIPAENRLDQPNTGAAAQSINRQHQFLRTVRVRHDKPSKIVMLGSFRPRRPFGDAPFVKRSQPQGLDRFEGRRASWATKAPPSQSWQSAMRAGRGVFIDQSRVERDGGHRATIRRVALKSWPPAVAENSRSH